ncbi:MAG: 50S ribosomal protein L4, partial [Chitinophagaceae bacterium]
KGGGTVFGPKPHGYAFKLNQKVKGLAKVSALSYKVKENSLFVVEDLKIETPKTKEFAAILKSINADNKKVLFLTPEYNSNVYLSYRNLSNVAGYQFHDMNTYDIVNSEVLVFTESAVKKIVEDINEN